MQMQMTSNIKGLGNNGRGKNGLGNNGLGKNGCIVYYVRYLEGLRFTLSINYVFQRISLLFIYYDDKMPIELINRLRSLFCSYTCSLTE